MKKIISILVAALVVFSGRAQEIVKHAPAGFDVFQPDIPHGKIDTVLYPSRTVGVNRKTLIYTPPGYSKKTKYPVLYLLHGIGGDEKEWLKKRSTSNHIRQSLCAKETRADDCGATEWKGDER